MTTHVHDPGGLGHDVQALYAYVADHGESGEGVVAVSLGDVMFPLIFADADRAERFRPKALEVKRATGKRIKLVRFERRVEIGEVE